MFSNEIRLCHGGKKKENYANQLQVMLSISTSICVLGSTCVLFYIVVPRTFFAKEKQT